MLCVCVRKTGHNFCPNDVLFCRAHRLIFFRQNVSTLMYHLRYLHSTHTMMRPIERPECPARLTVDVFNEGLFARIITFRVLS